MSFISERYSESCRYLRYLQLSPVPFAFFLCTAIIIMRNPAAVFRAEFWAEDATEFFFGSLTLGLKSLITPVYGYHFFISRLIAYTATFFPVLWTPFIYAIICLLINGYVTSYFARQSFAWIISSTPFRIFVCMILAVGPGTMEVFLNLCNLPSVLTFFGLLLLIEKPFRLSSLKLTVLIVLAFAAGPMFLLTPIVAFLWFRSRDWKYLFLMLMFGPIIILNAIGNHYAAGDAKLLNYDNIWLVPAILSDQFFIRLFFMPFLGEITRVIMKKGWLFWPASLIIGGVCTLYGFRQRRSIDWDLWGILFISFLCAIGSFAVIAISRNYAIGQIVRQSGLTLWDIRYAYLPGMVSLIIWFTALFGVLEDGRLELKQFLLGYLERRKIEPKTVAVYAMMFLLTFHNLSRWNASFYALRPDVHWPKAAASLQKILDQRKQGTLREPAVIDDIKWIHPVGWVPNHGKLELIIGPD